MGIAKFMNGKFQDAPLVYVCAQFKFNFLDLTLEQEIAVGQALQKTIFRKRLNSKDSVTSITPGATPRVENLTVEREAYFSMDQRNCLVIDKDNNLIEFRTSRYERSNDFIGNIFAALKAMTEAVTPMQDFSVAEVSFNYVDIIAPKAERQLQDYFAHGDKALPLSVIKNVSDNDVLQIGSTRFTRVLKDNRTRLDIEIEQLPKSPSTPEIKYLPNQLVERNRAFSMPIDLPSTLNVLEEGFYAMVWTKASKLPQDDIGLGSQEVEQLCVKTHGLAKESFHSLINQDVCKTDWNWVDIKQEH